MDKHASVTLTDFSARLGKTRPGVPKVPNGAGGGSNGGRLYGGLTVLERRAVRRKRLLDAGLDLFAGSGYASATIEGICASAGVTARHFYEEFGSREELLKAVFDRSVDTTILEVTEKAAARATVAPDFESQVREGVNTFVHAFLDDPRRARVVCIESVGVSAAMEAHRRRHFHRFSDLLQVEADRMSDHQGTSPVEFVLTTRALVGGTAELIVDWLLEPDPAPLDVVAEVLANLFLAVISYN
jgi:AcrR family transcriptional regulator